MNNSVITSKTTETTIRRVITEWLKTKQKLKS